MVVVKNLLNVIVALPQILREEESTLVYIVINVSSSKNLKNTEDFFQILVY